MKDGASESFVTHNGGVYRLTGYRFCTKALRQKSEDVDYHSLNFKMIYHFLDWNLNQRTGKNGRSKRGLKSKSSLVTFWCLFRLAFERATTFKIDELIDRRRLSNVRIFLIHVQPAVWTTNCNGFPISCFLRCAALPDITSEIRPCPAPHLLPQIC